METFPIDSHDKPVSVLVIDDEDLVRQVMCELLEREGFATAGFADPLAALASLASVDYSIALVDLNMPTMDGIAVIEAALRIQPSLACLIVTGEGDLATSQRALTAGAIDYMLKPFDIVAVRTGLERALRIVALRETLRTSDAKVQQCMAELAFLNRQLVVARNAAQLANDAKSRFLASMSHELRTPLNSIIGFSHILKSSQFPKTWQQVEDFSSHILQSAHHLLAIVNEVLDLARVESGKVELHIEAVQLAPLLEACRQMIGQQCAQHGLSLHVAAGKGEAVMADVLRLRQILFNLLSNGVKYNTAGGSLKIAVATLPAGDVAIAVSDTGSGIAPEMMSRLFQPFDRLGRDQHAANGTGLGLALADRLARQMFGRIEVDSVVGKGSTFTLVLPAAPPVG